MYVALGNNDTAETISAEERLERRSQARNPTQAVAYRDHYLHLRAG